VFYYDYVDENVYQSLMSYTDYRLHGIGRRKIFRPKKEQHQHQKNRPQAVE
jgi:hypothetical protein